MYFPSIISILPDALESKCINSSFELSAIDKKVVIKQLFIAATNKCSGDQMPSIPFGNCGGVATSISLCKSGEFRVPLRSVFQLTETS